MGPVHFRVGLQIPVEAWACHSCTVSPRILQHSGTHQYVHVSPRGTFGFRRIGSILRPVPPRIGGRVVIQREGKPSSDDLAGLYICRNSIFLFESRCCYWAMVPGFPGFLDCFGDCGNGSVTATYLREPRARSPGLYNESSKPTLMSQLSIVIVNTNTRELVCQCLESVYANAPSCEFEVIVVDNASSDRSCEAIESRYPCVRIIRNSRNVGFSIANNQALEIAEGSICCCSTATRLCRRKPG